MWLFEMAWIPFFAAGVINGLGHWWATATSRHRTSHATRRATWSLITCGEALHNNHHHLQNSPRFAMRRGELDPGYWYFRALSFLGLARAPPARDGGGGVTLKLRNCEAEELWNSQFPSSPVPQFLSYRIVIVPFKLAT
jgi:hypothetical protein